MKFLLPIVLMVVVDGGLAGNANNLERQIDPGVEASALIHQDTDASTLTRYRRGMAGFGMDSPMSLLNAPFDADTLSMPELGRGSRGTNKKPKKSSRKDKELKSKKSKKKKSDKKPKKDKSKKEKKPKKSKKKQPKTEKPEKIEADEEEEGDGGYETPSGRGMSRPWKVNPLDVVSGSVPEL